MKNLIISTFLMLCCLMSCKKNGITTDVAAGLQISADSLHFDTVFTSVGSVTQYLVLHNPNNRALVVDNISLNQGAASHFSVNVDGVPLTGSSSTHIPSGDSIYIFVTVTINPSQEALPFIVEDSIRIAYNGNEQFVALSAYGQNAHFVNKYTLKEDEVWNADLPYVITGALTVPEGLTLTIQKGATLYLHADAAVYIEGTMVTNGTAKEKVAFSGNRLDRLYKNLPGAWPGITFKENSKANRLTHTEIKNAVNAVTVEPSTETDDVLVLDAVRIDNSSGIGLRAKTTQLYVANCLIINNGTNVLIEAGGKYNFENSTITAFDNGFVNRAGPVVQISNLDEDDVVYPLQVAFTNCILWGDHQNIPDELSFRIAENNTTNIDLNHTLYKAFNLPPMVTVQNSIANEDPLFDSVNVVRRFFDFGIGKNPASPAVGAGKTLSHITEDIRGDARQVPFDLGCYNSAND